MLVHQLRAALDEIVERYGTHAALSKVAIDPGTYVDPEDVLTGIGFERHGMQDTNSVVWLQFDGRTD